MAVSSGAAVTPTIRFAGGISRLFGGLASNHPQAARPMLDMADSVFG
jgi:hypothetical protein